MTEGAATPVDPGQVVDAALRGEVVALITAADECASRRDPSTYADLFAEEGRMTGAQGVAAGRAALRSRVAEVWSHEPQGSVHLTLNPTVGAPTGDRVAATSRLVVLDPQTNAVVAIAFVSHELQHLDGRWRFLLRHID